MNEKRKKILMFVLLSEGVGALSGWLTREGMKYFSSSVDKPALNPPPAAFPIAWAALYALMGVGAGRVAALPDSPARTQALRAFYAQLAVNFVWSLVFFNLRAYGPAFAVLAALFALIVWMILSFGSVDRTAALLQIPYLLWVLFAGYLNYGVWMLNE